VSGPYLIRFYSPPRRRPDAVACPTARDVSQRAEPNVRPLGYAASAFIEDKARRLSIPLAGGVPHLHLLRHVHSACRWRPIHSAGGVPAHSTGRRHSHTIACTTLIITRTLPRKQPPHINTTWTADIMTPRDCSCVTCISYSYNVFLPLCSWAHMSGLSILVCAPLSYKREGTQRYKADPRTDSQALKHTGTRSYSIQHTHSGGRVLHSDGLNHSKSSCSSISQ
jgi:hypothetical protein